MRLFVHQLRAEQRVFWRNRESAVFIFIFPLMLFALLGALYGDEIDGRPAADVLLAGILGYGAANTAFAGIAISMVIRRESGILKRLRATPLPARTYVAATVASTLLVFAIQAVALFVLGRLLYGASMPDRVGSLALVVLVGAIAFAAIGFAAAAVIRSSEGASAVVNVILLPMAFLSGSFGPTTDYPAVLEAIGKALPLRYFIDLVNRVYLGDQHFWSHPVNYAVLGAWALLGLAVAMRRFEWQPRER